MKLFFTTLIFTVMLYSASFTHSDVDMTVSFHLSSENKRSDSMNFESHFSVLYNKNKSFGYKNYCFYDSKKVEFSPKVKKAKYRICLLENGETFIYGLSESFRYRPMKSYEVQIETIDLTVKDKNSSKRCKAKASEYVSLNEAIGQCLKSL